MAVGQRPATSNPMTISNFEPPIREPEHKIYEGCAMIVPVALIGIAIDQLKAGMVSHMDASFRSMNRRHEFSIAC